VLQEKLDELDLAAKEELDGIEDDIDNELEPDENELDLESDVDKIESDIDNIQDPQKPEMSNRQEYDLSHVTSQLDGMVEHWFKLAENMEPEKKENFLKLGERLSEIADVLQSEFLNG